MPELRMNLITREWVIFAMEKGKRPEDFIGGREKRKHPEFVETCPFCPGNEAKAPDERFRVPGEKGWKVRAILNKFSVLSRDGVKQRGNSGMRRTVNGVGIHEIIVDTPVHNHTTALMPVDQIKDVIRTYRNRFIEAYKDPRVEYVIVFKNNGHDSGTTIEHSLSQVVGMPITPRQVRNRFEGVMKFFDDTGECLMCRMINDELSDGSRVLFNTDHFVSFVPYAAVSPFHVWIFPKRHSGSFADIRPEEIDDLASNLKSVMGRLYFGLVNPDFNYIIKSGKPSNADSEYIHWYLTIVPRIAMASGVELGSGMFINPLAPEVSADFLRRVRVPEYGQ